MHASSDAASRAYVDDSDTDVQNTTACCSEYVRREAQWRLSQPGAVEHARQVAFPDPRTVTQGPDDGRKATIPRAECDGPIVCIHSIRVCTQRTA